MIFLLSCSPSKWQHISKISWSKSSKLKTNWVNLRPRIFLKFLQLTMVWPNIIRCITLWQSLRKWKRSLFFVRKFDLIQWTLTATSNRSGIFILRLQAWRNNTTWWRKEVLNQRSSMLMLLLEIFRQEIRCWSYIQKVQLEGGLFKMYAVDATTVDSIQECSFWKKVCMELRDLSILQPFFGKI